MFFRKDKTDTGDAQDDATAYCKKLIAGFRGKADHNKAESQFTFALIVGASLISPAFVTLGEGQFYGKIVPASLSLIAAAATSWLQLRKPQRLWALYRNCQRALEDQEVRHRYNIEPYSSASEPNKLLAEASAKIAMEGHRRWEGLIPDVDALSVEPGRKQIDSGA